MVQLIEKALAVIVVMAFGGTVLPALIVNGAVPSGPLEAESPAVMFLFAGVYVLIIGLVLLRQGIVWQVPTVSPILTALVVLVFLSAIWSIFPDVTLRRSVALLFTTSFGIYLALRYRLEEAVAVIAVAIGLLILLSFVFVAALPTIGIDQDIHRGAWRGVFSQKNVTGRVLVWFALGVMWLDWVGYGRKWLLRGGLAAAFVLLIMSRSGTGLMTTLLVGAVMMSVRMLRVDIRRLIPALALIGFVGLVVVTLATANFHDFMYMLGRDPTLTGRTELWDFGQRSLEDHFLLGYGYAAFWYGLYGPASYYTTGWGITSIHNGWLEVMLDVGLPGLVLLAVLMGRLLFGGVMAARYLDGREAPWLLAAALALLAISISESVFLERHSLNWVIFVIGVTRVALLRRRAQQEAQPLPHAPQAFGYPQTR